MTIKIIVGDYDRPYFYSLMGKYFAEANYRRQMPYLLNRPTNIWFLVFEKHNIIGFGAINESSTKIVFEHSFVEGEYRNKGIWKKINDARIEYSKDKNKILEVITKEDYLEKYWIDKGFIEYRQNGRYKYLRKDVINEKS